MSDFSFINELSCDGIQMQKCLQEFYECAITAEKYYNSKPELAVASIREGAELACSIYALNKNMIINIEGLHNCLHNDTRFVQSLDNTILNKLRYIEANAEYQTAIKGEIKKLLETFFDIAKDLYITLGGTNSSEKVLQIPQATKINNTGGLNTSVPFSQIVADAFKLTNNQLQKRKTGDEEYIKISTSSWNGMQKIIEGMKQDLNTVKEQLQCKDTFLKTIDQVTNNYKQKIEYGQKDINKNLAEMMESFKKLEMGSHEKNMKLEDIYSKILLTNERLDGIDQKQSNQQKFIYQYTYSIDKTLNRFVEINEKNMERLNESTKHVLEKVKAAGQESMKIAQDFSKQVKEISAKIQFSQNKEPSTLHFRQESKKQNKIITGMMSRLRMISLGRKNYYYRLIFVSLMISYPLWGGLSYLLLNRNLGSGYSILWKAAGLTWYFISWISMYIAKVGIVFAIIRSLATLIVNLVEHKKLSKNCMVSIIRTMMYVIIAYLLGRYLFTEFYMYARVNIGWKNILMSSDIQEMKYYIRAIFDHWRRVY